MSNLGPSGKTKFEEKFAGYRHINEKLLEIKHHIQIYNNVFSIMNWWDGDPVGIEIVSESLADMQRQVFWRFWEIAGEEKKKK